MQVSQLKYADRSLEEEKTVFFANPARLTHKKQDLFLQQYLHPAQEPKASGSHSNSLLQPGNPRGNGCSAHSLISPLNSARVEHLFRQNNELNTSGLLSLVFLSNGTRSEAFAAELRAILEKQAAFPRVSTQPLRALSFYPGHTLDEIRKAKIFQNKSECLGSLRSVEAGCQ